MPANPRVNQCLKPTGWQGRFTLWRMNLSHSKVTNWGLSHLTIPNHFAILDIGCGGGRTVGKLAALATDGKVFAVDFSDESVAATKRLNARAIAAGRVEVHNASVSHLPFADGTFDLVTAVETHFWWPDLPNDLREIFRVLKPGGQLAIIAEVYKGADTMTARVLEKHGARAGLKLLSIDEHRQLLANAAYSNIQISAEPKKGWLCATAERP
ncbi:MAG TPA: class I SAM-dependent methyltransferase [Candidatus Acidoferrum sp.]|jgi:ubiquinone/menaquinone biosynthesis C-methylase UbiE